MTWQVRFTALAKDDVAEAYAWCHGLRRGLGEEFLAEVEEITGILKQYPESCPAVHRGLRRALLSRFPYSLYYRLHHATEMIEVRGCIHQERHPRAWRRRE